MKLVMIICFLIIFPIQFQISTYSFDVNKIKNINKVNHIVDAYCYTPQDSSYTADGSLIYRQENWIAVSRDLLKHFPFNSVVLVSETNKYNGIYIVKDLMNSRHSKAIDFMILDTTRAVHVWKNIKIKRIYKYRV